MSPDTLSPGYSIDRAHVAGFAQKYDLATEIEDFCVKCDTSRERIGGYMLADRGTWLSFKNRGDLAIVVEGDDKLFNQYGVILVDPGKHAHVKKELGQAFIDWLVSPEGQKAIADYKINGEQLFFPNATVPGA